jgi:hypothetical protein
MLQARRVAPPDPSGAGGFDPSGLEPILTAVAAGGADAVPSTEVDAFIQTAAAIDPDTLGRSGALGYWINLYNAAAIGLAGRAGAAGVDSVLDLASTFTEPIVTVAGEALSLDAIEHGKIRRFGDPRIHAALVCGSISCPTLYHEPFRAETLEAQLDDQMRHFLASGGYHRDEAGVRLSRILLWYGADFVRPHRMPSLLPASRRSVLGAISRWLEPAEQDWIAADRPKIGFDPYDWSLGCAVRRRA